jgi:hypothetical protein
MIPNYPDIVLLPRRPEILAVKEVIATEKLHGCVVAKTLVSMADSSRKAISSLVVGDQILGVEGGRVTTAMVTQVFKNGRAEKWLKISGSRRGAGRGNHEFALRCTPEHHVWDPSGRQFCQAGSLKPGDSLTLIRSELEVPPLQQQVLLGKMLGDGSLSVDTFSAHVSWGHREQDAEYTRWVSQALGDLDAGAEDVAISGYGSTMVRRRTVNSPLIQEHFGDFIGEGGIKRVPEWVAKSLTPIALAFWYMDDGSLSHSEGQEDRAQFATCGFTETDCEVLVQGLARLGVSATISDNSDGWPRIGLGAEAAEALFLLVAPYIPKCMQRKLPERYRGHDGWLPRFGVSYKPRLTDQKILAIEEDTEVSSMRYDIETTTHNYFANGVLVHNSNFRIHFPLGMSSLDEVGYGSREVELAQGVDFPLTGAVRWFRNRPELLAQMWEVLKSYGFSEVTVFGEAYGPGIHAKGVKYTTEQEMLFRAFDIMVGENFLTFDLFTEVADKMGLPRVSALWRGDPTKENFDALLNKPSEEAQRNGITDEKNLAEGVVLRSNPLLRNVFGEWLIVKHKGTKFSEVAHAVKEKVVRGSSPADDLAVKYITEGRLLNALGRLQDRGQALTKTMKDMPVLLAELLLDVAKECDPDEKTLVNEKSFGGAVSRVLGPLYRKMTSET